MALYPTSGASDIRSFGFGLETIDNNTNIAKANFEVNDITIIYRTKNVK